ncbi:hypoxanthine-guanine phosphoribosyltransferase [Methylobacillus sp. MM3]|jgi:hypoxanthine phosphoribosyltransferase|uniref:hypoxanthine-guanine phosphoribosyltransferase n=1 Tax=Methylobacillus sp. MM3 TaxID=1848039 RepID=UPI0007E041CC|nr:hypoxanthine-guanine phosphoribosyltransferase [Methylobacillus sp. MM3]OAJ71209.1 hypoxanthine-guanine phosphoribosyltransferase [Methylobacillus sp. MM3]
MTQASPRQILEQSEILFNEADVASAIKKLAAEVSVAMAGSEPLVLCVMSGATVFAGQLLPLLRFPLEFDYVQASRYHNRTTGGQDVVWKMSPGENVRGRTLLLLDDILDEGHTLAAVRKKCLEAGAARVMIAVLTEKETGREKPVKADFVGLRVPDRYVFGCGMDVYGWWRNLPAIHALKK